MKDLVGLGLPFAINDLCLPSTLHVSDPPEDDNGSLFQPLNTHWKTLEAPLTLAVNVKDVERTGWGYDDLVHHGVGSPVSEAATDHRLVISEPAEDQSEQSQVEHHAHHDSGIWAFGELTDSRNEPKLHSWEAFEDNQRDPTDQVALLSEAGPDALDAVLATLKPLDGVGLVPHDYALRSLCSLALGRPSNLYRWDSSQSRFVETLQGSCLAGISYQCSKSLCAPLVDMGSSIVRLRTFVEEVPRRNYRFPAQAALRTCMSHALSAIDELLSHNMANVRSILQLQRLIQLPRGLLRKLEALVKRIGDVQDDTAIICVVTEFIKDSATTDSEFSRILEILLAKLCVPWLEQLAGSLGFQDPTAYAVHTSLGSLNISAAIADMPSFVDAEDATIVQDTIEAVELLRSQSSDHPLLISQVYDDISPITCFTDAGRTRAQIEVIAAAYERRMTAAMSHAELHKSLKQPMLTTEQELIAKPCLRADDGEEIIDYLDALPEPQGLASEKADTIYQQTLLECRAEKSVLNNGSLSSWLRNCSNNLLERVQPLIHVQHRMINHILLRRVFVECCLLDHLDMQWQFHLFGNGDFVTRLSTALFETDVQSAERKRGKMPNGGLMGLRLGVSHEKRWPPASSELQLTLMGILSDTYSSDSGQATHHELRRPSLPGGLSFAVRQLSEHEIDRVLDPNSIYALDFLRLHYVPDHVLNTVFTPGILENYDNVFQFLLRLLRLTQITGNLLRKRSHQEKRANDSLLVSFTNQARSFIVVLATYTVDMGVGAPWYGFMNEMKKIEQAIGCEDFASASNSQKRLRIRDIRRFHEDCLDRIRTRLFLKRRQEGLRTSLENVLSTILTASFAFGATGIAGMASHEKAGSCEAVRLFNNSVRSFCSLLRRVADKPAKATIGATSNSDEADMAKMILSRLNWNWFYHDTDDK